MQAMIEANQEDVAHDEHRPSITFLNMSGDVTITWTAENRDRILELVREKMAKGCSFFVLKPRALSILGNSKKKLTSAQQLEGAVGIVVPDSQLAAILSQVGGDREVANALVKGRAEIAKAPATTTHATVRRAATAEEVVKHQTVAVKPIFGG